MWKNITRPIDALSFTENMKPFIQGGLESASNATEMRAVTDEDLAKLVKEAEGRIAADPNYELGPNWNQQTAPQLAMQYLLGHRQMEDPIAAGMAKEGYLRPKRKEE